MTTNTNVRAKFLRIVILAVLACMLFMLASCTGNAVSVVFYADGAVCAEYKVKKGDSLDEVPAVPTKKGHSGTWSIDDFSLIESDLRVEAIYKRNVFTISYSDGEKIIYSEEVLAGKTVVNIPAVPEKEGYTAKWNVSPSEITEIVSDVVVYPIYTAIPVSVTFYKDNFVYTVAPIKVGNGVTEKTYYEEIDSLYVLTSDTVFSAEKTYYTRQRERYASVAVSNGILTDIPEAPATQNYSTKWMRINDTSTGEVFTTPDFENITESFSVVAYPYVKVSLVDTFSGRKSSSSFDIGETVKGVQSLVTSLSGFEFYAWYYDAQFLNAVTFPFVAEENITLYAKWISTKATKNILIVDGVVKGFENEIDISSDIYIPTKYEYTDKQGNKKTDYVTKIEAQAFKNRAIKTISLPSSIVEIGDSAFYGCALLTDVMFPDGNYIQTYGDQCFRGCVQLKSFAFSAKNEVLGEYAFYACTRLEKATGFENCLFTSIPRYAFYGCESLLSLTVPNKVTSIGESAFQKANKVKLSFADENKLQRIGSYAFSGCERFDGVLTENLRELGISPFEGCSLLTKASVYGNITVPELFGTTTPDIDKQDSYYAVNLSSTGKTYYIPNSLNSVIIAVGGDGKVVTNLLYNCYTVKSVTFTGDVKEIETHAFFLENYLPDSRAFTVQLPSTLQTIRKNAFTTRNDLTVLSLPASLVTIEEEAFLNINSLTDVSLPAQNKLTYVGKNAFVGTKWYESCLGLVGLGKVLLGVSENYCREYSVTEFVESDFSSYSIVAPYAFQGNTILRKISLAGTVYQIGEGAFMYCTKLETFAFGTLPLTITRNIGKDIFVGCSSLRELTVCEDISLADLFGEQIPSTLSTLNLSYSSRNAKIQKEFVATEEEPDAPENNPFYTKDLYFGQIKIINIGSGFTSIEPSAFDTLTSLMQVSFASGLTTIGKEAFCNCTKLEKVILPDSLTSIDEKAFFGCKKLTSVGVTNSGAEKSGEVVLPSSLIKVAKQAFAVCTSIQKVITSSGLSEIGEEAFEGCSSLQKVSLEEGIIKIGNRAFKDCNLLDFTLPSTLQFVFRNPIKDKPNEYAIERTGEGMLQGNTYLSSITLSTAVTMSSLFCGIIPETLIKVTARRGEIADLAFYNMKKLSTVILEEGVTIIGEGAFKDCSGLTNIVIPASVSTIKKNAFENCTKLDGCTFTTKNCSLRVLEEGVFKNCIALKNILLPNTITQSSWEEMFYNCQKLESVNLPTSIVSVGDRAYLGCERLVSAGLHNSIRSIGVEAFKNCTKIELDNVEFGSLTYLGESAFENCQELKRFRAENLSEVGKNIYKGCTKIEEITILTGDLSYYCDNLDTVQLVNIGCEVGLNGNFNGIFSGALQLRTVVVYAPLLTEENVLQISTSLSAVSSGIVFLPKEVYNSLTSVPVNVYSRPSTAQFGFAYNTIDLTATVTGISGEPEEYVYLPETVVYEGKTYTVTSIGAHAFLEKELKNVFIPSSVVTIESGAFLRCAQLTNVEFESGSHCLSIGENAFKESGLVSLSFPSSVTSIGNYAFSDCEDFESAVFSANSKLSSIGVGAFEKTPSLTNIRLTGPLSSLGEYAFSESGLQSIDFGSKTILHAISAYAFYKTGLTSLVLPVSVQTIYPYAFFGYGGTSLVLPASVVEVGAYAFGQSTVLTSLTLYSGLQKIDTGAFADCEKLGAVVLPDSLVRVGERAFYNCLSLETLSIGKNCATIDDEAFSGTVNLTTVLYYAVRLNDFADDNEVFYMSGTETGIALYIEDSVRFIPKNFFYPSTTEKNSVYLASVEFVGKPSCESIGANAFRSFKDSGYILSSPVVLPASILHIGAGAFGGRESMSLACENIDEGARFETNWKENIAVTYGSNNLQDGDFGYVLHDNYAYITKYTGNKNVVIPSYLGGKKVVGIGTVFENSDILSVTVPAGVTFLGSFYGCDALKVCKVPEGIKYLPEKAFYNCSSLLYFRVPASLVEIGKEAFYSCDLLTTVYVESEDILLTAKEALLLGEEDRGTKEQPLLSEVNGGLMAKADIVYVGTALKGEFLKEILKLSAIATRQYNEVKSNQTGYSAYSTLYWQSVYAGSTVYSYLMNSWSPTDNISAITQSYAMTVDGIGEMTDYVNKDNVPWIDYRDYISEIIIGQDVTSIGKYSFYGMENLKKVTLNAIYITDKEVEKYFFTDSGTTYGIDFTIGDEVLNIPSYLFSANGQLKSITWGAKVASVGKNAFADCTGLTSIVIPDTVTTIGARAFVGCHNVEEVVIGKGVKTFGESAFGDVGFNGQNFLLKTIRYNAVEANDLTTSQSVFTNSNLIRAEDTGTELIIHKEVSHIPSYLFYGCDHIRKLTFEKNSNLVSFGNYSFAGCSSLISVTFPSAELTTFGEGAFYMCSSLSAMVFSLTQKIQKIGQNAFSATAYSMDETNWLNGVLYLNKKNFLLECNENVSRDYKVEEGTVVIAERAFGSALYLTYVHIPSSVRYINDNAFEGMVNLKTVFVSSKNVITGITSDTSMGGLCKYARTVYILAAQVRESQSIVGEYIRAGYELVEKNTLIGIDRYYSYTNMYWACGQTTDGDTNDVYGYLLDDFTTEGYYILTVNGTGAMKDFSPGGAVWKEYASFVTKVVIGAGITVLGSYAFEDFIALQNVSFLTTDDLKAIGEGCFYRCSNLPEVSIVRGVKSIGKNAFYQCLKLEKIHYNAIQCADFALENNVFSYVGYSTTGVSIEVALDVVTIPSCFLYSSANTEVLPNVVSIKFLGLADSKCEVIGSYAFCESQKLNSLVLSGSKIMYVGEKAFYHCSSLTSLEIPTGILTMGDQAYAECTGIKSLQFNTVALTGITATSQVFKNVGNEMTLTIGNAVTTIPSYLFEGCTKMTVVDFPSEGRLELVQEYAFSGCIGIKKFTLPNTVKKVANGAFYGCKNVEQISIPFIGGDAKSMLGSEMTVLGYIFGQVKYKEIQGETENDIVYEPINVDGMEITEQHYSSTGVTNCYIPIALKRVTVTQYTNVYYGAFYNCQHIEEVVINKSEITHVIPDDENNTTKVVNGYIIGDYAFYSCTSLLSVTMTDVVTEIGEYAFYRCLKVSDFVIHENVTTIGKYAFAECANVSTLTYKARACDDFTMDDRIFYNMGKTRGSVAVRFDSTVERIPANLFNCPTTSSGENNGPKVRSIEFATVNGTAKMTSIGKYAFANCLSLEIIGNMPSGLQSIGVGILDGSFSQGELAKKWSNGLFVIGNYVIAYDEQKSDTPERVDVADGIVLIADGAFSLSEELKTVVLPKSLVYIGRSAFEGCTMLTTLTITMDDNNQADLQSIGSGAFSGCSELSSIVITSGVKYIGDGSDTGGDGAFFGCTKLFEVTIFSKTVCKSISGQYATGRLCTYANIIYVDGNILYDETGSYIRTKYSKMSEGGFTIYMKKE